MPLYAEVGDLHQKVHAHARELLKLNESGQTIVTGDYDSFMDVAHAFRVAVQNLQFKMVSEVCAVDHLTGVWNRYALSYKLAEEHARVHRTGNCCAVAIIDFDHFKSINDRHGHLAGDKVLKMAMEFFSGMMRAYDSIYRYGGEEVRDSVSIGLAAMDGQLGMRDVIEMADNALLHAKMNGRDSLHVWS